MLNDKQMRFCQEYIIDGNATQAYIRAGYDASSANANGNRLILNDSILSYIAELQAEVLDAQILKATEIQIILSGRIREELNGDGLKAVDILNKMQGNYSLDNKQKTVPREYRFIDV